MNFLKKLAMIAGNELEISPGVQYRISYLSQGLSSRRQLVSVTSILISLFSGQISVNKGVMSIEFSLLVRLLIRIAVAALRGTPYRTTILLFMKSHS